MEAKLQKMKVPELKELLTKHELPTTGRKEELVQRLLAVEQDVGVDKEQLLEPPVDTPSETPQDASTATEASASTNEQVNGDDSSAPATLTPEQEAMRKRAARFGIPYDPNAPVKTTAPKSKTNSAAPATTAPAAAAAAVAAPASAATPASNKREKIAPDGVKSLGISDEVLAKRAAKFGPVDVQPAPKAAAVPEEKKEAVAATEKAVEPEKVAEVDPAIAQRLQEEEEKKRKRAEKFGTTSEPADKKTKV